MLTQRAAPGPVLDGRLAQRGKRLAALALMDRQITARRELSSRLDEMPKELIGKEGV